MTSAAPKQSELPKCKTCHGKSFVDSAQSARFVSECPTCNGTGLDLRAIRAALRLSDRVANATRYDCDVFGVPSGEPYADWAENKHGEFIKLSDLTETTEGEAGNG